MRLVVRVAVAVALLSGWPLLGQTPDSTTSGHTSSDSVPVVKPATAARTMTEYLLARFPGLVVYPTSGVTGAGARVRIRGHGSLYLGNRPVVYVDGVRVEGMLQDNTIFLRPSSPLDDIDVESIDSIEVIRGPASGGYYGAEAGNGVMLVHTARPLGGGLRWRAYAEEGRVSDGVDWPVNYGGVDADHPDSVYRNGGCRLLDEAALRCAQDYIQTFSPLAARSPFRTTPRRRLGLRATGGGESLRYAGGLERESSGGPYRLSDREADLLLGQGFVIRDEMREPNHLQRTSAFARVDARPVPSLGLGAWASVVSHDQRLVDDARLLWSGLTGYSSGGLNDGWRIRPGQLFQVAQSQDVTRIMGGLRVTGRVAGFLTVEGLAGWDSYDATELRLQRAGEGPGTWLPGFVENGRAEIDHRTLGLTVAAEYRWNGAAARSSVGLREVRRRTYGLERAGSGLPPGSGDPDSATYYAEEQTWWRTKLLAGHVEQRVSWGDRVVAAAGFRADVRDVPAVVDNVYTCCDHDLVLHPHLRFEWSPTKALDVRAAYGTADQRIQGSALKPERTKELELGARTRLAGGRATIDATFYARRLSGGIGGIPPAPFGGGFGNPMRVLNTGVELSLAGAVVRREQLAWDVVVSAWGNRNRVSRAPARGFLSPEGYPLGGYWGSRYGYSDSNGDGIVEQSEIGLVAGSVFLGTPFPSHGAALWQSVAPLSGLRVSALLEYRAGHHLFNGTALARCGAGVCAELFDRRTPLDRQADVVAALYGVVTPGFIEDADFLKLREVALHVDVPRSLTSRVRARAARITIAGRNLLTWTKYSGPDPEVNGTPLPEEPDLFALTQAQPAGLATQDRFVQPQPRIWTLRLDVEF